MIKRYKGFTLAEVLVTLLIIGVVAAITIPALVNTIQDRQFKEAAKEAFSKASQAVQQMKQDNGGSLADYYTTNKSFKPVFINYFKVIKDCNWNDCVPASLTSDVYTSLHGDKANTWVMNEGQFITNDGTFWGILNNGIVLGIAVDVNGYIKGPNTFGKDTYVFQVLNDNLVPMGGDNTHLTTTSGYCNKTLNSAYGGMGCMDYVMRGVDY